MQIHSVVLLVSLQPPPPQCEEEGASQPLSRACRLGGIVTARKPQLLCTQLPAKLARHPPPSFCSLPSPIICLILICSTYHCLVLYCVLILYVYLLSHLSRTQVSRAGMFLFYCCILCASVVLATLQARSKHILVKGVIDSYSLHMKELCTLAFVELSSVALNFYFCCK